MRLVPLKVWIGGALVGLLLVAGGAVYYATRPTEGDFAANDQASWFDDVTDQVGVHFVHDAGDLSEYLLPQINGSGVALFDFDGDGRLDIYLLSYGGPGSKSTNRLYK